MRYAWEKLYAAVRSATQSEKPLQQRLLDCYLELHSLEYNGHLPGHLRKGFQEMISAWSRETNSSGRHASVSQTIEKMNDEEARKWLYEVLSLFVQLTEQKAVAEASHKLPPVPRGA